MIQCIRPNKLKLERCFFSVAFVYFEKFIKTIQTMSKTYIKMCAMLKRLYTILNIQKTLPRGKSCSDAQTAELIFLSSMLLFNLILKRYYTRCQENTGNARFNPNEYSLVRHKFIFLISHKPLTLSMTPNF